MITDLANGIFQTRQFVSGVTKPSGDLATIDTSHTQAATITCGQFLSRVELAIEWM